MARAGQLLIVVVVALLACAAVEGAGEVRRRGRQEAARLRLVRAAQGATLAERAGDDRHRHEYISAALRSRRSAAEEVTAADASAFTMPLTSGAYTGTGQYFVRLRVGTPAQPFVLVADTGSDLTWVKCRGSAPQGSVDPSQPRVFRPSDSKSWRPIPCSSDTCKSDVPFSLASCSTPPSPCSYDYRYKDNSSAQGVVGIDAATVALSGGGGGSDKKAKLQEVVLGCTTSYDGQSFQTSDGVLSLGISNISFASRAAKRFGDRFSYCLVDHLAPRNATSYLIFGPGSNSGPAPSQTPLVLDPRMAPFYAVTVEAITIAGETLNIPSDVWNVGSNGGAILDSGTSLTVLATPAYKAVTAALSKQLAGVPRVTMDPFEYCYNWTSSSSAPAIPKLSVRFAGSAQLEPPGKSYVIDAAPGVKCIGLQEGPWPGVSVIGNILQQDHLWEFDLANRWLRFKHTQCSQ